MLDDEFEGKQGCLEWHHVRLEKEDLLESILYFTQPLLYVKEIYVK